MNELRELFLLRRDITFLNHGSFGACPSPVFAAYQEWQRRLEEQPVEFLGRKIGEYMLSSRQALAPLLGVLPSEIIPVTNATYGVNVIAHSLPFSAGDEIVVNNHEYGACTRAWSAWCAEKGGSVRCASIPLPLSDPRQCVDAIFSQVSPRTKLIFLSHITSPTGLIFPVAEVCREAATCGIPVFVDGAHAPGHIDLDLSTLGATYYTGNLHKWLCTPKGSAFLYVHPAARQHVKPLVVSWGNPLRSDDPDPILDEFEYGGTYDPSAFLAVSAAMQFRREHRWDEVGLRCREMIRAAKREIESLPRVRGISPESPVLTAQMVAFELEGVDAARLKCALYDEDKIEIPVWEWEGRTLIRLSLQGYNSWQDVETLVAALRRRV